MLDIKTKLREFVAVNQINSKGPLSVVLVITRMANTMQFPINPEDMLTDGGGQVKGLGKAAVQAILKKYKITRILSEEGGRTSRGSINNMRSYVEFLNGLYKDNLLSFKVIEEWWIERIKEYFASKPFKFKLDSSKSIRSAVRDLIDQAFKRQKDVPGTMFAGAIFQHLVGAKLELIMPNRITHNGFSVADTSSKRLGDFSLDDVCIHVTTSPGEAVVRKCKNNLDDGLHPIVITTSKGVDVVDGLASNQGIEGRIDVFEIEQFIATNIYEISKFAEKSRKITVSQLVEKYNAIVERCETDPSLKIEIAQ